MPAIRDDDPLTFVRQQAQGATGENATANALIYVGDVLREILKVLRGDR